MKTRSKLYAIAIGLWAGVSVPDAWAQFEGYVNHGLVGVGRLSASLFDKAGDGAQDTLGGFSGMAIDPSTLTYQGGQISGTLIGLPDRGFGDGATDYHPRLEVFQFTITPYQGDAPVGQDQIVFTNTATRLLKDRDGRLFTGFDSAYTNNAALPQSLTNSIGGGRLSFDPEGIVLLSGGGLWISDEYGPVVYRFDATDTLVDTVLPPAALLPRYGNYPGFLNFTALTSPLSGRRNNRGLEGLSMTPDGKRLVAVLQSPNIQDGGAGNLGRNTRILQIDADSGSAHYGRVLSEHVYPLTLNGAAELNRHTPVSELLAVNSTTFLVLERDSNGLGTATNVPPMFKRIVLASTLGATNIAGTGYDLERGAPGQVSLPPGDLPSSLRPVVRQDFVDLLDARQLGKFGLNTNIVHDANTLGEKWEALALIPLKETGKPNDYLLLVGNDNDFKAPVTYHNGVAVGTNTVSVDHMLLAYRVTLPGINAAVPANTPPTVGFQFPTGNTFAVGPLPLIATPYDADGLVSRVEFFEDGVKLGEATTFPWRITHATPSVGQHTYRIVVTDNDGAMAEASRAVEIVPTNTAPMVGITLPVAGTVSAPFTASIKVATADSDGFVSKVDYYDGTVKVATSSSEPFGVSLANLALGTHNLTAVATDNLGLSTTSASVEVIVTRAKGAALTLQILHASDFEAGIAALDDAPRFSSVVSALKADFPTNTIVVASGDTYIPGPFFTASADPAAPFNGVKGRADIAILNAIGLQASCFGNHEFDDNTALVRSLILPDAVAAYAGTAYPYLSANLNFATDSSLSSLVTADGQEASAMRNKIAKSALITVAGQKIGLVGGTATELRSISSPGNVGVSQNLVEDIQSSVDKLLSQGANKIVVLTHLQQFGKEFALARQLRDVDVIVAGGSHSVFAKPTDRLRPEDFAASAYPTPFTSASGEPVQVVNTGANYRYVGRLVLTFDEAGVVTSVDGRSGAYATDVEGVLSTGNFSPAPAVVDVVKKLAAIVDGKDGNRFGRSAVYLNGLRTSVRTEETNLGDLTADANLFRAVQTDPSVVVSIKNGGGIRDSIGAYSSSGGASVLIPPPANPRVGKQAGEISQLDIENSLRFNNTLSLVTLTAQQLRDTMEWGVAGSGTPGQFPHVSGLIFSFNPTNQPMSYNLKPDGTPLSIKTAGERLRNLVVIRADESQDLVVENGVLVGDATRTFRVVTLNFLANAGDNYLALSQGTERRDLVAAGTTPTFATDGGEQRALADYLKFIGLFTEEDGPAAEDYRIQNLSRRGDVVIAPLVRQITAPRPAAQITFRTLPGKVYAVEAKDAIESRWERIGLQAAGTGALRTLTDSRPSGPQRYYRVVVVN